MLDKASVQGAFDEVVNAYGKVDVLINGAGGNHPKGTTSKEFLSLYDEKWMASSIGEDFKSGPELQSIWMALPFSPRKSMSWFVPLFMEILGGIIDWSEPHPVRIRQVAWKVKQYLPQLVPFIVKEVIPLLTSVLGEDRMDMLTNPERLLTEMPEIEEAIIKAFMVDEEDEQD